MVEVWSSFEYTSTHTLGMLIIVSMCSKCQVSKFGRNVDQTATREVSKFGRSLVEVWSKFGLIDDDRNNQTIIYVLNIIAYVLYTLIRTINYFIQRKTNRLFVQQPFKQIVYVFG